MILGTRLDHEINPNKNQNHSHKYIKPNRNQNRLTINRDLEYLHYGKVDLVLFGEKREDTPPWEESVCVFEYGMCI